MRRKVIMGIAITILVLIVIFSGYFILSNPGPDAIEPTGTYVIRVIDGDTVEFNTGKIVRLLCVDTPEKGEEGYLEAKEYLEAILLDKSPKMVQSEYGAIDQYGRALKYLYLGKILINQLIIDEGHSELYLYGNETCYRMQQ